MGHDLQSAMRETSLTEEEAYFLLRFADRLGYDRAIKRLGNPWKNFRRWFVWFGGWEHPELSQWDRGKPAWEFKGDPFPLSLFGHRITLFGKWAQFRCFGGTLVFANDYADEWFSRIYWLPDGSREKRYLADWSAKQRARRETRRAKQRA